MGELNENLALREPGTCEGLLPPFLLDGSQVPKSGADSPGSLPGGGAPKPRLEREAGVSQQDIAQGCLIPERDQGLVLRKEGKMTVASPANCVFHSLQRPP